jgi:sugar O-acyltransferase (sialic acid O-acetyltransferase NeuD family)
MLIVGAGGFAKELLNILIQNGQRTIALFDNVNHDINLDYHGYKILQTELEVKQWFQDSGSIDFCLGIGGPKARMGLSNLISGWGGILTSVVSKHSDIGSIDNYFQNGVNICSGVVITSNVKLGIGCLLNLKVTISHDCIIGDYVEISPGASIAGHCMIGSGAVIGTNATIIPNIKVGENSVIAAGAVVTKDVPSNVMVAGVPAIVKRVY